jgi:propanol-preferring alcohol dehydrogenase
MKTMKAALLHEFGKPLAIEEVPVPVPQADEVLVRVESSGVCHSDLHMAKGDWPDVAKRMVWPAILGHESVGRVVELGAHVKGPAIGTRVGVGWLYSTCGQCIHCASGAENVCLKRKVTGIAAPGGFAEYMRMKASHAIAVPEEIPVEEAAPYFCAGLTVFHACRNAGLAAGQDVAILGIGGLGHIALQLALNAGARVTAVDLSDAKLEFARALGAARVINGGAANAAEVLAENHGPQLAIVTAPSKAAYDLAFKTLRRRGTLAVVGIPDKNLEFHADDMVVGEFRMVGSAVGTRAEMREVLALAAAKKLHCESEVCRLEDINGIFQRMERGQLTARAVIKM